MGWLNWGTAIKSQSELLYPDLQLFIWKNKLLNANENYIGIKYNLFETNKYLFGSEKNILENIKLMNTEKTQFSQGSFI